MILIICFCFLLGGKEVEVIVKDMWIEVKEVVFDFYLIICCYESFYINCKLFE